MLFFLLTVLWFCNAKAGLVAIVFKGSATTLELSPTLESLRPHVTAVKVCVPEGSSEEQDGYMHQWSRQTGIVSSVQRGTRNVCLRSYFALESEDALLIEWNMRLHVNESASWKQWTESKADYALASDQAGMVLDWSPIIVRPTAHCGYLGRFVCVDSYAAHQMLLGVHYELDVDPATREVIERSIVHTAHPPVLSNVHVVRTPPRRAASPDDSQPIDVPQDTHFAYAWYWMGREYEARMAEDSARFAYAKRLDESGDSGDLWYAVYRLGDTSPDRNEAARLLLEAHNIQPKRREALAALARRYADDGKYALCHLFGAAALSIPFPSGPETGPHVEVPLYEWMVADELSVCLARMGNTQAAAKLAASIITNKNHMTTLDAEQSARIKENFKAWKQNEKP